MSEPRPSLDELVRRHGWAVIKVPEDDRGPGFAYTVGLYRAHGHPELFMSGLPLEALHAILNDMAAQVRAGAQFTADQRTGDVLEGYDVVLRAISPAAFDSYLGAGVRFYEDQPFPALHVYWPDRAGRFPWEAGVDAWTRWAQPTLSDGTAPTTTAPPAV